MAKLLPHSVQLESLAEADRLQKTMAVGRLRAQTSAAHEWGRVARGEIPPEIAFRLIKGRLEGEQRMIEQKAAEKLSLEK